MSRDEAPLPAELGPVARFAADLRELRRRAGSPTYREMVKRVHYSLATLSGAASGRKLPSLQVTVAYVKACGGDTGEWEQRWRALAADLAADTPPEPEHHAPYVGLAAFQREDTDLFFGREQLVDDLVACLGSTRFAAVFGASGAGKSSLLRAGLLARWPHQSVLLTPGSHPLEECAVQLARLSGVPPGRLRDDLAGHPRNLHRVVRQTTADSTGDLLFVVNQFEETFTVCRDHTERTRFIDALVTAARAENSRCRIVIGVRSDFHVHCTSHPVLREQLRRQLAVGPMTTEELRRAISLPASRAGCTVEGALLAELVANAAGQIGVLPLLSHALLETWRRRRGNTLTLSGFQAAGGIDGALAHTAETVYTGFDPPQQEFAKNLFQRLTALGEGTEDTKRRIDRSELDSTGPDTEVVVERLAAQRLLTVDGDCIEITHEALIRCWPRLHEWLTADRDALRVHRRLTEAAHAWQELNRDDSALYRGVRLATVSQTTGSLNRLERDFLDASAATAAAEQEAARRSSRRLRQLVALLTVLLVLAVTASGVALRAQRQATEQRNTATAQRIAERAAALRVTDPALAAQLSLAAYRLSPTDVARSSLLSTFGSPHATRLTRHTRSVDAVAVSPGRHLLVTASADHTVRLTDVADPHHPRELATVATTTRAVAVSPDGRTLATGDDNAVSLWDITSLDHPVQRQRLTGHTGAVSSLAFSPDGRSAMSGGADSTVRIWDLSDASSITLSGHTAEVRSVAFSQDGRVVASAGADHTVRLWSPSGTSTVLSGHQGAVNAVTFGPRDVIASAGDDHTVRLWDRAGTPLASGEGHTDAVRSVAFAGDVLVSGGVDASVRLWDVDDPHKPHELALLAGHTGAVTSMTFHGGTLATASGDHTVRLWDLPGHSLAGHRSSVYGAEFSPDGQVLATASYDRTARLWRLPGRTSQVLTGHTGPVNALAFNSDGRLLATASADTTIRLWRVDDATSTTIEAHKGPVESVAWRGDVLASASADTTAVLWDVADPLAPARLAVLTEHTDTVNDIALSADAVATASNDHTVRLWDRQGRPQSVMSGHTDAVKTVAFSPDGRLLASGGSDRSAALWDVSDPRKPARLAVLTGYTDAVKAVAFSPDGRVLATASSDKTAVLWDVATRTRLAVLTGHTKPVDAISFSPDGHTVVTAGEDWLAKLWETDPDRVAGEICAVASPPITAEEWQEYFPDISRTPLCG